MAGSPIKRLLLLALLLTLTGCGRYFGEFPYYDTHCQPYPWGCHEGSHR